MLRCGVWYKWDVSTPWHPYAFVFGVHFIIFGLDFVFCVFRIKIHCIGRGVGEPALKRPGRIQGLEILAL